jgi:hypothetical protein
MGFSLVGLMVSKVLPWTLLTNSLLMNLSSEGEKRGCQYERSGIDGERGFEGESKRERSHTGPEAAHR